MKTTGSKYFVEILCSVNLALLVLPFYVIVFPLQPESIWGYLALCSVIAWIPIAIVATIVAINLLLTRKRRALNSFSVPLSALTVILNLVMVYILLFTRLF